MISGLQEAAAQRFDDFLAARGIENIGKDLKGCKRTGDHLNPIQVRYLAALRPALLSLPPTILA